MFLRGTKKKKTLISIAIQSAPIYLYSAKKKKNNILLSYWTDRFFCTHGKRKKDNNKVVRSENGRCQGEVDEDEIG